MSEAAIQKKIIDYLQKKGAYVVKVISANKKGVPDIIAAVPIEDTHFYWALEIKRPETKNNVSKLQQYNLDSIKKANGEAGVYWSVEQVEEAYNEYRTYYMGKS